MMRFQKFGKYTIIKKLASGGMADILLATDLSPTGFGRFVVIKRALSKFSENEEFKDMFKNEGNVACNLKHRNITPIYEFGIEKSQFFLSMEYISGKNLRELSRKLQSYKSAISIPNIVYIIKEAAAGLNYAHNAIDTNTGQPLNLIHRDISPQNIMLSFDGEIKIIDFGISKIADTNLTRAGHLKGKFSYMSPEQANGELLDERTDIFCLGIILWELLTNKRLFASKNELSSLKKVKNCDIPNPQKINPKIPHQLNDIVLSALRKNKNSRYKTASKLEQDLNLFLNKNYPEYSHYEFISLMKTTYRKEIMEERENLKTYSEEFKKYINTLNIEERSKTKIDLSIPDLSSLIKISKEYQNETKTLGEDGLSQGEKALSSYISTKTIEKSQAPQTKEYSSTLIQRKEYDDTYTKENETRSGQHLTTPNDQPPRHEHPSGLKLEDSSTKNFDTTLHSSFSDSKKGSRIYNAKDIYDEDEFINKKKHSAPLFLFLAIICLSGLAFASYWVLNNTKLRGLIKAPAVVKKPLDQKKSAPALSPQPKVSQKAQTPPAQAMSARRKVLINSKPSGAAIYIDNKFISKYTPYVLDLETNKKFKIVLKKEGYLLKRFIFHPGRQNNSALDFNLKADHQRGLSSNIHVIQ